jgi:hypothetical protein
MDDQWFREMLEQLERVTREENGDIRKLVAQIVPTYHPEKQKV